MSYDWEGERRHDMQLAVITITTVIICVVIMIAAIFGARGIAADRDQCAAKGGVLVEAQYGEDVCISRKVLIVE